MKYIELDNDDKVTYTLNIVDGYSTPYKKICVFGANAKEEEFKVRGLYKIIVNEAPIASDMQELTTNIIIDKINQNYIYDYSVADKAIEVPLSISMRQARLALLNVGLLEDIENAMVSMPRAVQIEWEYASVIERNNPLISQIASSFGLSEEQLNDLFILGSKI